VLVVGGGFVGQLSANVLRRRGDTVFVHDRNPERAGSLPDGPVDGAVLCAPGGSAVAVAALGPGGTLVVFADAGELDLDPVYRRELSVLGSRSATPRHMREAVAVLPELDLPTAEELPLERFQEGLARYQSGEAMKVVFRP
jgi:threonine dehydrogenase-like Zn-dependent dehydrogenase